MNNNTKTPVAIHAAFERHHSQVPIKTPHSRNARHGGVSTQALIGWRWQLIKLELCGTKTAGKIWRWLDCGLLLGLLCVFLLSKREGGHPRLLLFLALLFLLTVLWWWILKSWKNPTTRENCMSWIKEQNSSVWWWALDITSTECSYRERRLTDNFSYCKTTTSAPWYCTFTHRHSIAAMWGVVFPCDYKCQPIKHSVMSYNWESYSVK